MYWTVRVTSVWSIYSFVIPIRITVLCGLLSFVGGKYRLDMIPWYSIHPGMRRWTWSTYMPPLPWKLKHAHQHLKLHLNSRYLRIHTPNSCSNKPDKQSPSIIMLLKSIFTIVAMGYTALTIAHPTSNQENTVEDLAGRDTCTGAQCGGFVGIPCESPCTTCVVPKGCADCFGYCQ